MAGIRGWKPRTVSGDPRVVMSVAAYVTEDPRRLAALRCMTASLSAQTYPHWQAVIVHDGPVPDSRVREWSDLARQDHRIHLVQTPERKGDHGHHWRRQYALSLPGEFVGFSNDDNYLVPVFLEALLSKALEGNDLVYCDMLHSHRQWEIIQAAPKRGFIDMGNWLCRRRLVEEVEWTDFSFAADWQYFRKLHSRARSARIALPLFVHN